MAGTRMEQRRGTAAEWAASNPVLGDGEIGWDKTTNEVKIGDGVTAWNDLPTYFVLRTIVDAKGDLIVGVADNIIDRLPAGGVGTHLEVQADGSLAWVVMPAFALMADVAATYETIAAALPISIIDASGDLIVGTGADSVARLPKGVVGDQLVIKADGNLGWQAPPATDLSSRVAKTGDTMSGTLVMDNTIGVRLSGQAGLNAEDAVFFKAAGDTNVLLRKADRVTRRGLDAGPIFDSGNRVYSASNPPPAGGSVINQMIRGTLAITSGNDSVNVTISSVNMAKAELRFLGWRVPYGNNAASGNMFPFIKLASSTSIRAERNDADLTAQPALLVDNTISYELTEWA